MNDQDPRQVLARRLRHLREQHWPGTKVTQSQLAAALGGDGKRSVSVPLISSWESQVSPTVPPAARIEDIALFFATRRSFDGQVGRLLSPDEMTTQEKAAQEDLAQELIRLRGEATAPSGVRAVGPAAASPLSSGPYRFKNREISTIVCAQLPPEMLQKMPYTDPSDPDYVALYTHSDLDSLLELFGHMRATNPGNLVQYRSAEQLTSDDYTGHLVPLGGVDWNKATSSVFDRLQLPVKQVNEWGKERGTYFEVTQEDGSTVQHHPVLEESGGTKILREDVALFARAPNPYNQKRFVIICNGMYGRGTYGAVRALTDERFRDRNWEYIQERFGDPEAFCILTRVTVERGLTLTPDWTLDETRLFEWSRSQ